MKIEKVTNRKNTKHPYYITMNAEDFESLNIGITFAIKYLIPVVGSRELIKTLREVRARLRLVLKEMK